MSIGAAAQVISVDCGVVGAEECARLKALSVYAVSATDKATIKSSNKSYLIAAVIATVAAVLCISIIVGLAIYTRKRLARKHAESVITEQRSYEWDTTAVNTPASSICGKTEYAYQEEVLFRLDVPLPHSS
ncbi:hypothetical protein GGI00_002152 [Coemansia sp. RSA 2681]|nr:hypothetical protein GGI00_002152 [Coemansia sp. RSA 2681]